MIRKVLFWSHLTAGCLAGAVILIMSVTGVLLAYERQLTRWIDRGYRSSPNTSSSRLPVESLLTVVAERAGPPSAVTLRSEADAPAEISIGRERMFYSDAYTGAVLGEGAKAPRAFFRVMEDWHRWLGMQGERRATGRAITGAANLAFLFIVLSGPFLWIPRVWSRRSVRAVGLFRGGLQGKARDFNWHNVMGIWSAAPLVVIVASGVVMSYPWANNLLYTLTGTEAPAQAGRQGPPGGEGRHGNRREVQPSFAGLNAAWAVAERQVPNWRSITLRLPQGRGPLTFIMDTGAGGRPDQRSQVIVDAKTAEVIRIEGLSSYNMGRKLRTWLRFLHTGEAGGWLGQTIASLATAGVILLVWTGANLSWRRLRAWMRRRNGPADDGNAESSNEKSATTVSVS